MLWQRGLLTLFATIAALVKVSHVCFLYTYNMTILEYV